MIDTKKLRQKILDLAIRGKLVPQDPNDEPASVLLERIRAEKERLIAEGKIKRPKKSKASSAASHYQNFEPPFPIPDSWEWCKLSDCCHIAGRIGFRGYTKEDLVSECNGAITLSPSNIVNDSMQYDTCTYISWEKYYESPEIQIQNNDILLVKTGSSFGKCALVKDLPQEATINPQFVVLKRIMFSSEYLTILLQSPYARKCYEKFVLGTAIPTFTQEKLGNLAIPMPPYCEQVRIIQKFQEIQSGIDSIILNKQELASCIKQATSKILDLAMQGKLVPQNPNDEPAADMLRRINPKAKIITDNPHSWNIPNNWCWTRIKDVFKPMEKAVPFGSEFLYIDIDSVDNRTNSVSPKQIKTECAPSRASRKTQRGDIVFSMVRPYLRNVAVVPIDGCIASTGFYILSASSAIYPPFAFRLALSDFFVSGLNSYMKGDNSPSINKSNIEDFVIPLPPFDEQKRIISEIDNIYLLVDSIKTSL